MIAVRLCDTWTNRQTQFVFLHCCECGVRSLVMSGLPRCFFSVACVGLLGFTPWAWAWYWDDLGLGLVY